MCNMFSKVCLCPLSVLMHCDRFLVFIIIYFQRAVLKSTEGFKSVKSKMLIWKAVVVSRFKDNKINSRKVVLEQLCQALEVYISKNNKCHSDSADSAIVPVVELLITIAQNTLVSSILFLQESYRSSYWIHFYIPWDTLLLPIRNQYKKLKVANKVDSDYTHFKLFIYLSFQLTGFITDFRTCFPLLRNS